MNKLVKWLVTIAAALFASAALAQEPRATFAQPELDQMLAPIALYPDSLLSQVLMASTYPQDVAEAASWSRAQGPLLRGEQAVRSAEDRPWDPSVVSLVAFPDVLLMLDERRDWTARLGEAFLAQPDQVMDTVQQLRARADEAGNLQSSREMVVQRQGEDYVIEPPSPDYFNVPYYDPRVVYGNWMWSDWPPVYWNPWPGYGWRYGYAGFGWGPRVYLGSGFFFGSFDWGHRYVRYASHRPWYHHGNNYRGGNRWTHGGDVRGGRDGRGQANWRGQGQSQAARNPDGRGNYRNGTDRRSAPLGGANVATAPAVTRTPAQQGFFRAEEARSATARAASPRYGTAAQVERGLAARSYTVPREGATPVERPVPTQRVAGQPQRVSPVRIQQGQHLAPSERAVTQQRAPVERVYTQRAAPVERVRVQQPPVERAAPVARAPVERAALARERTDLADRGDSRDSSPVSRGGGGGGGGRGRDR